MRYDGFNPVDHAASLIQTCAGNAEEALAIAQLNVDFAHDEEERDYWDRVAIAIQPSLNPGGGAGIQCGQQELIVQEVPQPRLGQPAAARVGRTVVEFVGHPLTQRNEVDKGFQPDGQSAGAQRSQDLNHNLPFDCQCTLSHASATVHNCSLSPDDSGENAAGQIPVAFLGPYGEVLRLAMSTPEEIEFANRLLRALGCARRWAQLSEN